MVREISSMWPQFLPQLDTVCDARRDLLNCCGLISWRSLIGSTTELNEPFKRAWSRPSVVQQEATKDEETRFVQNLSGKSQSDQR